VVSSAPSGSPRSRGLETQPSTPAIPPYRFPRGAEARAVRLSHTEPRRLPRYSVELGPADQVGLRYGPLICPRCRSPMKIIALIIDLPYHDVPLARGDRPLATPVRAAGPAFLAARGLRSVHSIQRQALVAAIICPRLRSARRSALSGRPPSGRR
jgi:hypothetical protein